ncbi:hypothetical protein [Staphylococcus phage SpP]
MEQMSIDDLINEKENEYNKNRWYALCYYDKVGKKKIPRQVKAHRDITVLEELKERLEERNSEKEYAIKLTSEFDKEIKLF